LKFLIHDAPPETGTFTRDGNRKYVPTITIGESGAREYLDMFFFGADCSYYALQVDINHRFASGLFLRGVYTWSKTIDDGDSLNATTSGRELALAGSRIMGSVVYERHAFSREVDSSIAG
jgi:hypothetical protein